jgi:hypothetical protein
VDGSSVAVDHLALMLCRAQAACTDSGYSKGLLDMCRIASRLLHPEGDLAVAEAEKSNGAEQASSDMQQILQRGVVRISPQAYQLITSLMLPAAPETPAGGAGMTLDGLLEIPGLRALVGAGWFRVRDICAAVHEALRWSDDARRSSPTELV